MCINFVYVCVYVNRMCGVCEVCVCVRVYVLGVRVYVRFVCVRCACVCEQSVGCM